MNRPLNALNQDDAAYLTGMSRRSLRRWGVPRNDDGTYSGNAVVAWVVRRAEDAATVDDDLGGSVSPALEEYRRERARAERRKNDEAERLLVATEDVNRCLGEVGRLWRVQIEVAERAGQAEVADAMRNHLEEVDKAWTALCNTRK